MKVKFLFQEKLKQYIIKSNSNLNKVRYEIHKPNCKDILKDNPNQVSKVIGKSAEDVIKNDISDDGMSERSDYKIMNCCKGY